MGPNSDPEKSTSLGEAAHIFGARPKSKRFDLTLSDSERAQITNGIWLCRNCHKLIDTDESQFSSDLLFLWRKEHERFVLSELGSKSDKVRLNLLNKSLMPFQQYPERIQRVVLDKPPAWEFRLAAGLMRHLNQAAQRKLEDLKSGLYIKSINHIRKEDVPEWVENRLSEMTQVIEPVEGLLEALKRSFGELGVSGDELEILHVCKRIHEHFDQVLIHEEQFYFSRLPEEYDDVVRLLKDRVASQVLKVSEVPDFLDEVATRAESEATKENPIRVEKKIDMDVPDGWVERFDDAYKQAVNGQNNRTSIWGNQYSLWWLIVLGLICWMLI